MKKYIILSLSFLAVFILLIFQSSFCWAYTDDTIAVNFSILNDYLEIDNMLISIDNSTGFLDDYNYCYIGVRDSANAAVYFTTQPIYFLVDETSNIVFKTDGSILYGLFSASADVSSLNSESVVYFSTSAPFVSTSESVYTDSTLSTLYTSDSLIVSNFLANDTTMYDVVTDIAFGLSLDTLFEQVNNVIPIIVIAVLFVFGFIIIRRLMKGFPKGKLKV